jgi:hypothetical protein
MMDKNQILEAYKLYWLENGKKPVSVYAFCKSLEITEAQFYDFYASFESVEKDIWLTIFQSTIHLLQEDETYQHYAASEKLLAFYFAWVQKLKENRSYILLQHSRTAFPTLHRDTLESFRKAFLEYADNLVKEGYLSNEIKERKYISDKYVHGFWLQALFVLKYWIDDTSEGFEMTDAAIEKAVTLSFQLISTSAMDSILDFGKFIFTKK